MFLLLSQQFSLFLLGGYYYYKTEPNKTYEETMIDVKLYADQEGIPYG